MERRVRLWWWWIAVVLALSFPWFNFTTAPQWQRVHWLPFTDPADRPRDFVLNVLLFVPFGISYGRAIPGARRSVETMLVAAGVSLTAETTQLFGTLRYPSATDLLAAVAGAAAGAAFIAWVER